jgi:hypothetical protein
MERRAVGATLCLTTKDWKPGKEERVVADTVRVRGGNVGAPEERGAGGLGLLLGRLFAFSGLVAAVVGLVGLDISPEAVGIVLGIVAYMLGARGMGTATIAISTILLLVVLAIGVGEIPGIAPTDPIVNSDS